MLLSPSLRFPLACFPHGDLFSWLIAVYFKHCVGPGFKTVLFGEFFRDLSCWLGRWLPPCKPEELSYNPQNPGLGVRGGKGVMAPIFTHSTGETLVGRSLELLTMQPWHLGKLQTNERPCCAPPPPKEGTWGIMVSLASTSPRMYH